MSVFICVCVKLWKILKCELIQLQRNTPFWLELTDWNIVWNIFYLKCQVLVYITGNILVPMHLWQKTIPSKCFYFCICPCNGKKTICIHWIVHGQSMYFNGKTAPFNFTPCSLIFLPSLIYWIKLSLEAIDNGVYKKPPFSRTLWNN